jgi:asparagine synthase (glutamine-hydrolysing)
MCGLTGFLTRDSNALQPAVVERMADAIRHRGPDDSGAWVDATDGIALGHRRLAIIDLTPAGHQPMSSNSGRFVLAFNGEIYNHMELRSDLKTYGVQAWRGHSDTETLLAAIEQWGVEETLRKSVGMFAVALWDRREKALFLARDRFGEKPLYYGWSGTAFVFGSELKALRSFPGFDNAICREALAQYLRFMYVPAPRSIYRGIYKLEPGCVLRIQAPLSTTPPTQALRPPATHGNVTVTRWWSMAGAMEASAADPIHDPQEAREMLEARLSEAVKLQSLADVPLGAFLSGGVDSSAIVALMQRQSSRPIRTFTVAFQEASFDESPYARAVARHLGTEHTEVHVTARQAQDVIPTLPTMYDEPFADSSQIPTHLVCRAARQHVTVALSGDAGDELFGGYNRYFWGPRIWNRVDWLPYPVRSALGAAINRVPVGAWDAVGTAFNLMQRSAHRLTQVGDKAHKLASRLREVRTADDLYVSLVSGWSDPMRVLQPAFQGAGEPASLLSDPLPRVDFQRDAVRMMYWDSITYLPDDILCKVDRAAMAVSLETRVPFLDHRVAELAWRLPISMKIVDNQGKWILRQLLYRHVPRELIERPKAGFAIPVGEWLRGPLRSWAEDLLDDSRLRREGYLDASEVRRTWNEHLSGRCDSTPKLWSVLMLQAWLQQNGH